jgi:hypothetical protein
MRPRLDRAKSIAAAASPHDQPSLWIDRECFALPFELPEHISPAGESKSDALVIKHIAWMLRPSSTCKVRWTCGKCAPLPARTQRYGDHVLSEMLAIANACITSGVHEPTYAARASATAPASCGKAQDISGEENGPRVRRTQKLVVTPHDNRKALLEMAALFAHQRHRCPKPR